MTNDIILFVFVENVAKENKGTICWLFHLSIEPGLAHTFLNFMLKVFKCTTKFLGTQHLHVLGNQFHSNFRTK